MNKVHILSYMLQRIDKQKVHSFRCAGKQREEIFENSACSVCMNRRTRIGGQTREFTYAELHLATNGFSKENLLSVRGKKIFRGQLNDLQQIMIREYHLKTIKEKDFKAEVQTLGKFRHDNVAMLLGSFSKGTHRLLIYEFICNGSLSKHLSGKGTTEPPQVFIKSLSF